MAQLVARGVVAHTVVVRILAGEKTGAAGRTKRRGDKGAIKTNSFASDAVNIRRFNKGMSRVTEVIPALIVHQDENDVRPIRFRIGEWRGRRKENTWDEQKTRLEYSQHRRTV